MADADRCAALTAERGGIYLDYSRQMVTNETMVRASVHLYVYISNVLLYPLYGIFPVITVSESLMSYRIGIEKKTTNNRQFFARENSMKIKLVPRFYTKTGISSTLTVSF